MFHWILLVPLAIGAAGVILAMVFRNRRWLIHSLVIPLMIFTTPVALIFISPVVTCGEECSTPQMIQLGPDPGLVLIFYLACLIPTMIGYGFFIWRVQRRIKFGHWV